MELMPAIDLLDGRAVRLAQGDFSRVTDYGDPFAAAARWVAEGATRCTWSTSMELARVAPVQAELVRRIGRVGAHARARSPVACVTSQSVARALAAGAARVVLGSALLASPDLARSIVEMHGPERLVAALDVRDGTVRGAGWLGPAGAPATEMVAALDDEGVAMFAVTAIARDGLLGGPDLGVAGRASPAVVSPARIIASAGVTTLDDVRHAGAARLRRCHPGTRAVRRHARSSRGLASAPRVGRTNSERLTGEGRGASMSEPDGPQLATQELVGGVPAGPTPAAVDSRGGPDGRHLHIASLRPRPGSVTV